MASSSISLRLFGYRMALCDATRHSALQRAIDAHGGARVVERLEEVKVNSFYLEQTEKDIAYVAALIKDENPEPQSIVNSTNHGPPIPVAVIVCGDSAKFVECIKLINEKLCKATIEKDAEMINLMVESMTNVIRSTL